MRRSVTCAVLALVLPHCTAKHAPETAGGAASHGWVELVVADRRIPADPVRAGAGGGARPPPCELELAMGGEPVLSRSLQPQGDFPPYAVQASFRFAAREGEHAASLRYTGCRSHGMQLDGLEAELPILVERGCVTRLHFDGAVLEAHPPAPAGGDETPR